MKERMENCTVAVLHLWSSEEETGDGFGSPVLPQALY